MIGSKHKKMDKDMRGFLLIGREGCAGNIIAENLLKERASVETLEIIIKPQINFFNECHPI